MLILTNDLKGTYYATTYILSKFSSCAVRVQTGKFQKPKLQASDCYKCLACANVFFFPSLGSL